MAGAPIPAGATKEQRRVYKALRARVYVSFRMLYRNVGGPKEKEAFQRYMEEAKKLNSFVRCQGWSEAAGVTASKKI